MSTDKTKPTTKRRGRKNPPKTIKSADAFSMDRVFAQRPAFGFLDPDRMTYMQDRVFSLLEDYGVMIVHPAARAAFLKAGAVEGSEAGRIKLPRALVKEALEATPKTALFAGKTPKFDMQIPRADKGFILRTGTGGHGYINPYDASYRNMDLQAAGEIAAVANDLDQVGFIAHPFVHGVPEVTADIRLDSQ